MTMKIMMVRLNYMLMSSRLRMSFDSSAVEAVEVVP
jgi:hypothetical protein